MKRLASILVLASAFAGAQATILTFDISGITNFQNVNQNYGDNVTGTTNGGFSYGVGAEGFTPDVIVEYDIVGDAALWTTGYGDLTNVLFKDADGVPDTWVKLTAAAGFQVVLYEWDMAAYGPAFGSDPTINSVSVTDGNGDTLFIEEDASISETAHRTFDFSTGPLIGEEIWLRFDAGNLGGLSDDIAFDNIRFGQQPVPEPATLAALGIGVAALLRRRKQ